MVVGSAKGFFTSLLTVLSDGDYPELGILGESSFFEFWVVDGRDFVFDRDRWTILFADGDRFLIGNQIHVWLNGEHCRAKQGGSEARIGHSILMAHHGLWNPMGSKHRITHLVVPDIIGHFVGSSLGGNRRAVSDDRYARTVFG